MAVVAPDPVTYEETVTQAAAGRRESDTRATGKVEKGWCVWRRNPSGALTRRPADRL